MELRKIDIDDILVDKNNPRSVVEEVDEMAESLEQHGQMVPGDAEEIGKGKYLLQSGHRRLAGLKKLQKKTGKKQYMLCTISKNLSETERLIKHAQLDSQMKNLSPKDRDILWEKLYRKGKYTPTTFAKLVGSSTTSVSDFIDRLGLPTHLRQMDVSQSVFKETKILDKKVREKVIRHVHDKGMGREALRRVVQSLKTAKPTVVNAYLKDQIDAEQIEQLKDLPEERAEVGIQAISRMKQDIRMVPKTLKVTDEVVRRKHMDAQRFVKRLQDEIVKTIFQVNKIEDVLHQIEKDGLDEHFDQDMKSALAGYLKEMNGKVKPAVERVDRTIEGWTTKCLTKS